MILKKKLLGKKLKMHEQIFICEECIGDSYLREEMKKSGLRKLCNYCESKEAGDYLTTIASKVDQVYRAYYYPGQSYPIFHGESDRPDYKQAEDYPEDIINMMIRPSTEEISNGH